MEKIRIGMFGAWRGNSYIDLMKQEDRIEIVAICDKHADKTENLQGLENADVYNDFDAFLEGGRKRGMNAVFLANYFNQHAPFAIKCLEAGMDVVSECTSASTMKECVELVEAVERTGRKYMIAENYPFMTFNLKMEKIISEGTLGTLLYAEGEYNHSGNNDELRYLTPGPYHWRAWMPRTYYVTHAMGPLMYMTKTMPKYVSGRAVHSDLMYEIKDWRHNYDGVGMMFCEMDNGMIARFTGCTAMASDYSRYRVCGDRAGVEGGGYVGNGNQVRTYWFHHTKPEDEPSCAKLEDADLAELGERGQKAKAAGHGGGDYWIIQNMIDYFLDGKEPFFDVYKGVAMSATAILGWRSALNHGENYKIPDFRIPAERDAVRNDDTTPFPDENGEGATLPCALPWPPEA
ncbi:MAG: Gfo/Idh/MocA family oxidoreductase [Clostridia bacterium]|nr:Gfo/Idh/MocA family oxidoreductase [Clostridia bacterium]